MVSRNGVERLVVLLGAVVAVVALALLGLSAYTLVGPVALNSYLVGSLVSGGLVVGLVYATTKLGQKRRSGPRRSV